jgi:hypothetical protein
MRLFRNNVGKGWVGKLIKNTRESITLVSYRPLESGLCVGSSDLIGWTTVEITPEMVGGRVAVFTALELKTKNVQTTKEQKNFLEQVQKAGGMAGIVKEKIDIERIKHEFRDRI